VALVLRIRTLHVCLLLLLLGNSQFCHEMFWDFSSLVKKVYIKDPEFLFYYTVRLIFFFIIFRLYITSHVMLVLRLFIFLANQLTFLEHFLFHNFAFCVLLPALLYQLINF
jgi:hypothetical protein